MNHGLFLMSSNGFSIFGLTDNVISFLLIDTTIKCFVLLMATLVFACLMKTRSAAVLHRLWTLAFCGCLVIPIITVFSPSWSLAILPRSWVAQLNYDGTATSNTANFNRNVNPASGDTTVLSDEPMKPHNFQFSHAAPTPSEWEPVRPQKAVISTELQHVNHSIPVKEPGTFEISWNLVMILVWVGGIFFCLLRTVWLQWLLARTLRRSTLVDKLEWTRAAADAAQSLGFHRSIELRRLDGTQSPMVTGIFRTIVLLPKDAVLWNSARCQLVLLHELAHAKRHDILTQSIAGFVCALFWFNPICWIGLLQMRKLQELACDDLVVASGQRPTDYADVLLDVARSYQHQNCTTAIGMSHRAHVEHRILALLDLARSHISLSPNAARRLLVAAMVIVAIIGSMRLRSQDEPSKNSLVVDNETSIEVAEVAKIEPDESKSVSEKVVPQESTDKETRTMTISIRDENGKPLKGAKLHRSLWYLDDFKGARSPNSDHVTNSDGVVNLNIPRRLHILRLWAGQFGHVPEFVNFAQGTHDQGKRIPSHFEFQLARGTELSGTVVDENNQPIPDVLVDVKVTSPEPKWTVNPKPIISTYLTDNDYKETTAITDKMGKWNIRNAPVKPAGEDHEFRLKFTHQDYISDSEWGELQDQQKLTSAMLRDGSAKIVLSPGVSIRGAVIDTAGDPVTKGLIIWHDEPYYGSTVHEVEIDNKGHFETIPLPPGKHPITVVAPGFMPVRQIVNATKSMEPLSFEMKPGKRLTLKIVDSNGKPVPKARISLGKWRGVESLYNHRHPNVLNSRIPVHSDEKGVYEWDWAPDDAVTYEIYAKKNASKTVTLAATEAEHVIKLAPLLIASGKVTDAETGKPIKEFRAVPVIVFRPQFLSTSFDRSVPGDNGLYEIKLNDGMYDRRHQIRIDADGYRSAMSENSFALGDSRVTQNFSLEPAKARKGYVVDKNGNPVPSAIVVQGTPSIVPHINNNKLEWSGQQIKTSNEGRFQLAATFEPIRVRVIHDIGFAEVLRKPDEKIGTIQLQPWAKVSGRLLQDGKPVPEQWIYFRPVRDGKLGEPRFQDSYSARTDADGRFEFKRLPPIAGSIQAYLGPWRDSLLTSSQAIPLDLQPGENKTLTLGGKGTTVTGKVVATGRGEAVLNKNWSLNYLIRRDGGLKLPKDFLNLSFNPTGPVQASWFLDPNRYDWLRTRPYYFVKLAPNGRLQINGVPPGVYDLVLRLYEQPAGCLVETVGEKVVTINVTSSDIASGMKDLGNIEVACRVGPRVGANMQIYKFSDTTGREHIIKDMEGRYVLMHVWASWCVPCLQTMPDIQATINSLSDKPITLVGLNIDKDPSKAKTLVEQGGWNWSQNYLGDESDMARQLAISSVPTYFLIGPDGLLVASDTKWLGMKEKLSAALKK
ncbi:M56 family metallopeptidase [Gimesia aquarii]|uniref:Regulatory protein BlaR1 n=1 Tax=Gimesia aquarii TaxID=2527964 RepID=A0A517VNQ0_9PLAN|nr:M56 family metallopeptidase [Gimesia aquarii]QDT94603.1 Regulatory protein BlaR1 [Gimesia aquarii]